jgi:phospholipid-binding lipoprotein MlaA
MKRARGLRVAAGVGGLASALAAGAAAHAQPVPEAAVEQEQAQEEQAPEPGEPEQRAIYDPWQTMNRGIFTFNDYLDRYLLEPVAIGWDTVVPEPAERGLANFFANVATPRRIANDLLQGKPRKAGDDFGRFLINTTFGVLGFFDPASAAGIAAGNEDFGQTLGVWGTPAGPYLVLPLFGPSSPRDTAGLVVDTLLSPEFYFAPWYVSYPASGTRVINARALALEAVRAERAAAFDLYSAVRSAYVQYRINQVRDREEAPEDHEEDESLYNLEEEE